MRKLIVTAQRLSDGRVVYLREDRSWTTVDAEAARGDDAAALEGLLSWAKTQTEVVVEPYTIEVDVIGDSIRHTSARERIRAEGPEAVLARFGFLRAPVARAAVG
jgi:type IV secretory pathway TrbF-like protein